MNKKGFFPIAALIWGIVIIASFVYGGIFYNTLKNDLSSGFSLTNPWLWIIAILVLILLIRRRRR